MAKGHKILNGNPIPFKGNKEIFKYKGNRKILKYKGINNNMLEIMLTKTKMMKLNIHINKKKVKRFWNIQSNNFLWGVVMKVSN